MSQTHKIFVSCGDLAGVGWQILKDLILKPGGRLDQRQQKKLSQLILVGDLLQTEEKLINENFHRIEIAEDEEPGRIKPMLPSTNTKPVFLSLGKINAKVGEPNKKVARRSYLYIQKAIQFCKSVPNSSLLTLPVSKEWIIRSGINFSGHTEELKDAFQCQPWMCMYHPEMSVIPLTNHIPLKTVSSKILKLNFSSLRLALSFFQRFFKPKKPMALLGLNPHAGEGGKIGKEESFLKKQLAYIREGHLPVEGIFPADAFFTPRMRKDYSLAIACYHDQALIPFKALYSTSGINITLNLPQLRASPDHGPAYSLAGSKNADINSVLTSLVFCMERGGSWIKHFSYPLLRG